MPFRLLPCWFILLWATASASGADLPTWTRFRGPNGAGLSSASRIPTVWSDENYLWRTTLPGHGHSSPVLWGDRLFITSADETTGTRVVTCLNAANGDEVWSRSFPAATHATHQLNSLAST